jgi:3',5'-cyclic AMP phosphodiesterase CpdA
MKAKLVVVATSLAIGLSLTPSANASDPTVIVAVGDIARRGGGQEKTAQLTSNLNPDKILLIGDLVYERGTDREFQRYFLPSWGKFLSKSYAVPGNHEYKTRNANGYRKIVRDYKLPRTGTKLWWAKKVDGWTIIGLDSEALSGSTGTAQVNFLKQALKENNNRPTIVTWHRPTYSRGSHGNQEDTKKLWNIISADKDVKLVLWGHDHNYEQVERTVLRGTASERKLNTIVVGTGGANLRNCKTKNIPRELICGEENNYGVLQLKLQDNSYSWSYRNANGQKLGRQLDSGRVTF